MDRYKQFGIPDNFEELLPELKTKTLKWETVCYSGTKINQSAKISYYATISTNPYGDIILSPGLGTNTDIDPLMKMLTFWALTHRHNVITLNTFLGEFSENPSFEQAQINTYQEFVSLLESSIKFIEPYSIASKNILIGHSAGATGIIDALNNIAKKEEKININSVMLFAPWASEEWHETFKELVYTRCKSNKFDNPHKMLPIMNVFDAEITKTARYMSIMPKFFNDMDNSPFRADLMNKWNSYITIIAGEKDKKAPKEVLEQRFQELEKQSNRNLFKFIVLPNAKHSFLHIYENNQSVISLIKSQRKKIR
jgi:hypothetical protein